MKIILATVLFVTLSAFSVKTTLNVGTNDPAKKIYDFKIKSSRGFRTLAFVKNITNGDDSYIPKSPMN